MILISKHLKTIILPAGKPQTAPGHPQQQPPEGGGGQGRGGDGGGGAGQQPQPQQQAILTRLGG